jgi:5-methylcytosine-specific restriction protein A
VALNGQLETRRRKLPWQAWYDRQIWRGPHGLRRVVLARDPVCMMCERKASTVADHIRPHRGVWLLFCDLDNLQGICDECHSLKTAKEDGGFGNAQFAGKRPETRTATVTGEVGKQFQSSSITTTKLNKALAFDIDDLLKGIPE